MQLSQFGRQMAANTPIVELMEDLGQALSIDPDILFLGGGNPAQVPEAQTCFRQHLRHLTEDPDASNQTLGVYESPQGRLSTRIEIARYLKRECQWPITERNIALTGGSQTAYFILLNLFAGHGGNHDAFRRVLLPLVPEYLGYASQGLTDSGPQPQDFFLPLRPQISFTDAHRFKYHIDFPVLESLSADGLGAVCVSRPTNPSGNLLDDDEVARLGEFCRRHDLPLIVDNAYGTPFPGVVFKDCSAFWNEQSIAVLSLSKLGLPGVRTGIVVANEAVIDLVRRANTVISLATGGIGSALLERLLIGGDLNWLSRTLLPTFYRARRDFLLAALDRHLAGLPYKIHHAEGAFFVWLWLDQLPIPTLELYQRLKQKQVLVMAGEPFFFGLERQWRHGHECLRLTYCQSEVVLARAAEILGEELRHLYA